jgi:hypothetical protein
VLSPRHGAAKKRVDNDVHIVEEMGEVVLKACADSVLRGPVLESRA